jgi:hypothetical protein
MFTQLEIFLHLPRRILYRRQQHTTLKHIHKHLKECTSRRSLRPQERVEEGTTTAHLPMTCCDFDDWCRDSQFDYDSEFDYDTDYTTEAKQ